MRKLTKPQVEILRHRLDSGVVADVLIESDICTELADAEEAVAAVRDYVENGELPEADALRALEIEVLADCLDGCTFFAGIEDAVATGELTRGASLSFFKAAGQLEVLISDLCGRQVDCVTF